jgi:hypothetical protein
LRTNEDNMYKYLQIADQALRCLTRVRHSARSSVTFAMLNPWSVEFVRNLSGTGVPDLPITTTGQSLPPDFVTLKSA